MSPRSALRPFAQFPFGLLARWSLLLAAGCSNDSEAEPPEAGGSVLLSDSGVDGESVDHAPDSGMNESFERPSLDVEQALRSEYCETYPRYLGCLEPVMRAEDALQFIEESGKLPDGAALQRVYTVLGVLPDAKSSTFRFVFLLPNGEFWRYGTNLQDVHTKQVDRPQCVRGGGIVLSEISRGILAAVEHARAEYLATFEPDTFELKFKREVRCGPLGKVTVNEVQLKFGRIPTSGEEVTCTLLYIPDRQGRLPEGCDENGLCAARNAGCICPRSFGGGDTVPRKQSPCPGRCEVFGRQWEIMLAEGDRLEILGVLTGAQLECVLSLDRDDDSFDCQSDFRVGDIIEAAERSSQGWCPSDLLLPIDAAGQWQCIFDCTLRE